MLRLNDSVAGFLLKQSIDKENDTIKKGYGYDSSDSDDIEKTLNIIRKATIVINKGKQSTDLRQRHQS